MDGLSIVKEHGKAIIEAIRRTYANDWKILVLDEVSEKIVHSSVTEDEILNHNVANIERIEARREKNPDMNALYILSPQPHIVECLMADFDQRRYRGAFVIWTGAPSSELQRRVDAMRRQLAGPPDLMLIDFYPRESHLVTFRDPHSFLVLYNPLCNDLVARHLRKLASKIVSMCIILQEMPKVRYYQPPEHAKHDAQVLCMHLARFVQQELDSYQKFDRSFPPPSPRAQSVLLITDRSMDLMAPLVHEFTYQAMIHDVLPIRDASDGKVTFHMAVNEGPAAEEKDLDIAEKDTLWLESRHMHMKDTIEKLMGDFQKFLDKNPNLKEAGSATLNDMRKMLTGMPQFQEMKQAYTLHINMAQEAMNIFQKHKLSDVASAEQTMATGLDEESKKPKNILDQVVRLLDDPEVTPADRLRLIAIYVLYRDGIIQKDLERLLWHASLQRSRNSLDQAAIENLEALGARPLRELKEPRQPAPPLFERNNKTQVNEDYVLSRFEPSVKHMLDHLCAGDLDTNLFPYTVPPSNPSEQSLATQGSLRSAAPRWASANRRQADNRQRIIVFVAGGATYSEARACYEASEKHSRDVFLATTHMVTPAKFVEDLGLLKADRRRLNLPLDAPPPRAPAHLFERPAPPPPKPQPQSKPGMGMSRPVPPAGGLQPPTKALGAMNLNGAGGGSRPVPGSGPGSDGGKEGKKDKEKEKKKRNPFKKLLAD